MLGTASLFDASMCSLLSEEILWQCKVTAEDRMLNKLMMKQRINIYLTTITFLNKDVQERSGQNLGYLHSNTI